MTAINLYFNLQTRLIQTSQTGGQWYSDTSTFSIPCLDILLIGTARLPCLVVFGRVVMLPATS